MGPGKANAQGGLGHCFARGPLPHYPSASWRGTTLYLLLRGIAAHIQKIGRGSAVQLDDVHGGHGQTCTVDHAADVAVQTDVVQVILASCHLPVSIISYVQNNNSRTM